MTNRLQMTLQIDHVETATSQIVGAYLKLTCSENGQPLRAPVMVFRRKVIDFGPCLEKRPLIKASLVAQAKPSDAGPETVTSYILEDMTVLSGEDTDLEDTARSDKFGSQSRGPADQTQTGRTAKKKPLFKLGIQHLRLTERKTARNGDPYLLCRAELDSGDSVTAPVFKADRVARFEKYLDGDRFEAWATRQQYKKGYTVELFKPVSVPGPQLLEKDMVQ